MDIKDRSSDETEITKRRLLEYFLKCLKSLTESDFYGVTDKILNNNNDTRSLSYPYGFTVYNKLKEDIYSKKAIDNIGLVEVDRLPIFRLAYNDLNAHWTKAKIGIGDTVRKRKGPHYNLFTKQEFVPYKVGQGLFYSGKVEAGKRKDSNQTMRFVFDCGSTSRKTGKAAVEQYLKDISPNNIIDLVVISHFDADHVNLFGELLRNNMKVKTLVLPFTPFAERLHIALSLSADDFEKDQNGDTVSLILNPVGFFSQFLDEQSTVILVTDDDQEEAGTQTFGFDFRFSAVTSPVSSKLVRSSFMSPHPRLFQMSHQQVLNYRADENDLIFFQFYRKSVSQSENKFYKELQKAFFEHCEVQKKENPEIAMSKVLSRIRRIRKASSVKALYNKVRLLPKFKDFKVPNSNLNSTALGMLHLSGTINSTEARSVELIQKSFKISTTTYNEKNTGVLLTSDMSLKTGKQVNALRQHFNNYWDRISLVQVPHHGSKHNSGSLFFNAISGKKTFINHGEESRYRHPNREVKDCIRSAGLEPHLDVHENINFSISYEWEVECKT